MEFDINEYLNLIYPWLLDHGIKILLITVGFFLVFQVVKKFIDKAVRLAVIRDELEGVEGELKREETLIKIFTSTARIVFFLLSTLMILQEIGIEIGPILAGAGIVGLAFGFGGQYLIRDIITGLFIILESQYRIGDVVILDGTRGVVENISLRVTTLRDMDGTVHHIPHGEIKKVSNLAKEFGRVNLNIGVSYNTKLEHLITIINQTGEELSKDELWKDFINIPPQFLRVDDFADSAIVVRIVGETKAQKQWEVTGELRKRIKIAFDANDIEIPFPQMVLHMPKPTEKE